MKSRFQEKKSNKFKIFLTFVFFIAAASFYSSEKINQFSQKITTPSQAKLKEVIRELIIEDLDYFVDAFKEAQMKQAARLKEDSLEKIAKNQQDLYSSKNSPIAGNPEGSVSVAYFFDYNCGFCHKANTVLKNLLSTDSDIKLIYKELPILGPESQELAKAALAVHLVAPDKYIAFHDNLMTPEETDYKAILDMLGIPQDAVLAKMNSPEILEQLEEVTKLATTIGLSGTPSLIIGNELVGAFDEASLKQHIEKVRKNKHHDKN
jgi:protein-disulfide isomerase